MSPPSDITSPVRRLDRPTWHMSAAKGALIGIVLAQGAPLGWLFVRWFLGVTDHPERAELLYMEIASSIVMGIVGWVFGYRQHRLEELNDRLEALALEDALTGLANARALHEALQREVARAIRGQQPLSLVLLDLDHFKDVNDKYGHLLGDRVLRGIGEILKSEARTSDLPARYGGEELALVLPDTDEDQAYRIAERIRRSVEDANRMGLLPVPITSSFGVAEVRMGQTALGFFASADRALYQAKNDGRNCVRRDPVYNSKDKQPIKEVI